MSTYDVGYTAHIIRTTLSILDTHRVDTHTTHTRAHAHMHTHVHVHAHTKQSLWLPCRHSHTHPVNEHWDTGLYSTQVLHLEFVQANPPGVGLVAHKRLYVLCLTDKGVGTQLGGLLPQLTAGHQVSIIQLGRLEQREYSFLLKETATLKWN